MVFGSWVTVETRMEWSRNLSDSHRSGLLDITQHELGRRMELLSLLAHDCTELVGGRGNRQGEDALVAGPGLPSGHREAKALQEAGEEEEELHAGQGLPQTCSAACGWERGSVSLGPA